MTRSLIGLTAGVIIVAFSSCKKDNSNPPAPVPKDQDLVIKLNSTYMPGPKIDSAIATFESGGANKSVKMQVKGDSLIAPLTSFAEGNGKFAIKIYSQVKFTSYASLWTAEKEVNLKHKEQVLLEGPAGFNDEKWLPRVLLYNNYMKIFAIVGLRPADPYFFVEKAEKNFKEVWISREYWKTRQGLNRAAGGVWECKTGCWTESGDILNTDFFKFLPQAIVGRSWDHIEIVIRYLMDNTGGGYSISMNYTFPL